MNEHYCLCDHCEEAREKEVRISVESLVSSVRSLGSKFESFHLQKCYCGCPMWQQPCMICGYYPMYGDPGSSMGKGECSKEMFCNAVNRAGGILEFYLKSFMRCIDPQEHILSKAREDSRGWIFPTPEEIWNYYTAE